MGVQVGNCLFVWYAIKQPSRDVDSVAQYMGLEFGKPMWLGVTHWELSFYKFY